MHADRAKLLRELILGQQIAALGTLHDGAPCVSMVPYAQLAGGADFFIHVSALAGHTRDMLANKRVSLLIISSTGDLPQSRARVTVQGDAHQLKTESLEYNAAKQSYIARFPQSAGIFELADFSMFRIEPVTLRVVGGFAQAFSLDAASFLRVMS